MSEVKVNDEPQEGQETETVVEDKTEEVEGTEETQPENEEARAEEAEVNPEAELEKAREEVAELRDKMLRAAAENENFKKRVEREKQAALKYAGETIFKEMLPAVDNLERAIAGGVVEGVDAEKNLNALIEGVQLTLKSLLYTLEKFEVKAIDSIGEPFDPKVQEALTMEASDTVAANHVINEFEKGYYYKDRLLRAAKVIVSSGKGE